jgi:glyceraldehyde 3-phosphate dehydrogenase
MAVKVALNGFGRIGRLVFRAIVDSVKLGNDIEVVAVNDLVPADNLDYLVKYDYSQGRLGGEVYADGEDALVVDGHRIRCLAMKDGPTAMPWKDLDIDVVIESTGLFTQDTLAEGHLKAGAKKWLFRIQQRASGLRRS